MIEIKAEHKTQCNTCGDRNRPVYSIKFTNKEDNTITIGLCTSCIKQLARQLILFFRK